MRYGCPLRSYARRGSTCISISPLSRFIAAVQQSPLYRSILFQWVAAAVTLAGSFLFWLVVARLYVPAEVGLASSAISVLFLMALISQAGMGYGLMRFRPETSDNPGIINSSLVLVAGVAFVSGLLALLSLEHWAPSLEFLAHPQAGGVFLFGVCTLAMVQVLDFYAVGLRQAKWIPIVHGAGALARVAGAAVFVTLGAVGVVTGFAISGGVGLAIYAAVMWRLVTGQRLRFGFDSPHIAKMLRFSVAAHAGDLLLAVPKLLMPLVVLRLMGTERTAYFYVAWSALYFLYSAAETIALSTLAEGSNATGGWRRIILHGLAGALALAAAGVLGILVLGERVLLLYGREYARQGIGLLRLGGAATIPIVIVQMLMTLARLRKGITAMVLIPALASLGALFAAPPLIRAWGLEGAAAALLFGYSAAAAIAILWSLWPSRRGAPLGVVAKESL